jgi:hypothetical protein
MIDIWVKLVANQLELATNLTRAFCGLGVRGESASAEHGPINAAVQEQAEAPVADPISGILSYLESTRRGATAREIAEHMEMDRKSVLPILKTLVREKKLEELLGRYCVVRG